MEEIRYRPANSSDAAAISDLVADVTRQHIAPGLSESGLQNVLRELDETSTRRRLDDAWPAFCATRDQALVGVIVVKPPDHLYQLFVQSAMHGKGIARRLFEIADRHIREAAGQGINTVNASLNAVAVYRRLGFELQGTVVERDGVRFQPMLRDARRIPHKIR
jgi:GNAT superfamily N-acetyltransferase